MALIRNFWGSKGARTGNADILASVLEEHGEVYRIISPFMGIAAAELIALEKGTVQRVVCCEIAEPLCNAVAMAMTRPEALKKVIACFAPSSFPLPTPGMMPLTKPCGTNSAQAWPGQHRSFCFQCPPGVAKSGSGPTKANK